MADALTRVKGLPLDTFGRVVGAACNNCGSYKIAPPDSLGGAYCTDCGSADVELPAATTDTTGGG